MSKKRSEELYFTTQIWGRSEGVEAQLRKLMDELRALRQEMANERRPPARQVPNGSLPPVRKTPR